MPLTKDYILPIMKTSILLCIFADYFKFIRK